jgi:hypothetical protein
MRLSYTVQSRLRALPIGPPQSPDTIFRKAEEKARAIARVGIDNAITNPSKRVRQLGDIQERLLRNLISDLRVLIPEDGNEQRTVAVLNALRTATNLWGHCALRQVSGESW